MPVIFPVRDPSLDGRFIPEKRSWRKSSYRMKSACAAVMMSN